MQKSQGDFWTELSVVLEIQRIKKSGPMIVASIEFATVTQHGDRGWNRAYVPININLSLCSQSNIKLYHTTRGGLRPVRNM